MPARRNIFGFGKSKVTYHRDVAKERRELRKHAMEERREQLAQKKQEAAERAHQDREDAIETKRSEMAERKERAARKRADAADREIEREWREAGTRNPGCANTVKGDDVTDRAKRYRATQPGCLPNGPKQCKLCTSRSDLMVDHKDGNESNGAKGNLRWLCRSCNTREGARMARSGKGRRTAQYNPGAETTAQYARAVSIHQRRYVRKKGSVPGHFVGEHDEGGAIIHATPKAKRREFASDIWSSRKAHGNPKRNPEDAAAALSEAWHGRPASVATDHIDKVHYHGVLTDLGRLKEITVMVTERKGQKILFDKDTRLASSENGKQLYVVGGDQSIDLSLLGIDGEEAEKDCVFVGEVHSIVYVTAKHHLGRADMIIGPYEHHMGEKGGTMPVMVYDRLNDQIGFAGGSYFIDPTDYDGSHSAGIRN